MKNIICAVILFIIAIFCIVVFTVQVIFNYGEKWKNGDEKTRELFAVDVFLGAFFVIATLGSAITVCCLR